MIETRLGAAVRQPAPSHSGAQVLLIEFAHPGVGLRLQLIHLCLALLLLLQCRRRIMGHYQTQPVPGHLGGDLRTGLTALLLQRLQQLCELAVAPTWHGKNELQRLPAGQCQLSALLQVVQAEQASVGHHNQAAQRREARHHLVQDGQQGLRFSRIPIKDFVINRQTLGRLNHPQHELPGNQAFLGHAELAHITLHGREPLGADGGHVVEGQREIPVHQRAQQTGHHPIDRFLVVHERVHAAQQLLMIDCADLNVGQGHRLQPAQHAQLGVRIAQAVEHHDANQRLHVRGVTGTPKDTTQIRETQLLPDFGQRPHVAQGTGGLKGEG